MNMYESGSSFGHAFTVALNAYTTSFFVSSIFIWKK